MTKKHPTIQNKELKPDYTVIKLSNEIRLSKMLASREARNKAKDVTITLKDFIKEEYHFVETAKHKKAFKCTIKDVGLVPFEIDIYDARIILVEVTGKVRKDFDGNEIPERLYRGRCHTITEALKDIAGIIAKRKIEAMPTTVITLRDYHNAYAKFYTYIVGIINPEYKKALNDIQKNFPFVQISEGRTDEEDWFKK